MGGFATMGQSSLFGWWSLMRYTFAPLEGVTGYVYRNLHRRWFGGVEPITCHLSPWGRVALFRPGNGRIYNESGDLVPQLLGKDAEGFYLGGPGVARVEYREINFNLGCPSGTVTAKGQRRGLFDLSRRAGGVSGPYFSALGAISIKTVVCGAGGVFGVAGAVQPLSDCRADHSSPGASGFLPLCCSDGGI